MSLYKDASLVMLPSAYKDGKLYSIRPTDGSGDFTFSRGSNLAATRVDVNGLIEKGRENHLLQSQSFDNASWDKTRNVVTANTATAPDGTNTADKIAANATFSTNTSRVKQDISVSGLNTISLYAKADEITEMLLFELGNNNGIYFNLTSGSFVSYLNGTTNIIDYNIEDAGNDWYRYSITYSSSITRYAVYLSKSGSYVTDFTIGEGFYVWGGQIENGLVATDYIETGASTAQAGILEDMPRLDYSGGASCPALLLEPQRTNTIASSEYVVRNVGGWDINSDLAITTENNSTTSPQGLQNAAKLIYSGSGYSYARQSLTAGAGTLSVYVKKGNWRYIGLRNGENQSTHSVFDFDTESFVLEKSGHTLGYESVGNGWYRIWDYQPTAVSPANGLRGVAMCDANGTENSPSTPSGSYNYVWGFQFELGASYPTSYIPTYGSSVTRSVDSSSLTSVGDLLGQTNGTIFIEVGEVHNNSDTGATKWFMEIRKDNSNSFGFGSGGADAAPTIRFVTQISGVASTDAEPAGFSNSKIAIRYTADDFKIYQNGVLQSTIAKSIGGYVDIQFMEGAGDDLSMPIKQFSAFPTALTDSECIALTTL